MSVSRQEEIIAALWAICAVLCFSFGHVMWGWVFSVKAIMDTLSSIHYAVKEVLQEIKASQQPAGGAE